MDLIFFYFFFAGGPGEAIGQICPMSNRSESCPACHARCPPAARGGKRRRRRRRVAPFCAAAAIVPPPPELSIKLGDVLRPLAFVGDGDWRWGRAHCTANPPCLVDTQGPGRPKRGGQGRGAKPLWAPPETCAKSSNNRGKRCDESGRGKSG